MTWGKDFAGDVKRLIAITLNKSDVAGVNWLNPFFAILLLFVLLYSAWMAWFAKDWAVVAVALAAFFGLAIAALVVFEWLSRRMLEQRLRESGKTPSCYANVSVLFRPIRERDVAFSNLNLHAIDGVAALCDNGDFYYMPWAWYTRRPLVRIGKAQVAAIESGMQEIMRDTVPGGGTLETVMAKKIANVAAGMADRSLPLDRTRVVVKTASGNHELLFHPKESKFVDKLVKTYGGVNAGG